jgi:DNA-binding MarR family transcriptional regulator
VTEHSQQINSTHAAAKSMRKVAAVSRNLKRASSAIEAIVQSASGGNDLTLAHWLILVHLARARTCKQGNLHSETGITAGHLTRLLDELEAKGLVRRRRSTEDRRQMLLSLSDRGRDATLSLLGAIDGHRLLDSLENLQSSLSRFLSISAPEPHQ